MLLLLMPSRQKTGKAGAALYVVFQQALKIRFDLMIIFCCWVESRLAFLETNLTRLTTTAATTPTTAEQQQRRMLLLLMSPLYQALRACRILCLVSCVLASSVVIEKVIRAHQICCAVEHKSKLLLRGHFAPLTITQATWLATAQQEQRRACTTYVAAVPSG